MKDDNEHMKRVPTAKAQIRKIAIVCILLVIGAVALLFAIGMLLFYWEQHLSTDFGANSEHLAVKQWSWTLASAIIFFGNFYLFALLISEVQMLWRLKHPPRSCRKCGYDLSASPSKCPECGATNSARS